MIGQTLGHYRILEKAGSGGMGVVYRAHDLQLERDVALKVLPYGSLASDTARRQFQKEALALAKLNHANIATVYEFGTKDGVDFIAMEYVVGQTLHEKLAGGSLPEKEVVRLGLQIAAALEEAHSRGMIHRDLKPQNIAITAKGDAKVLDFGLAKLLRQDKETSTDTATQPPEGAGTLPYMSPEQVRAEDVDARGDVYSLGAVLYEMATAHRAYGGEIASRTIDAILHQPPAPPRNVNRGISSELERIILKCLEKDPENRFQSAKELQVDLRRLGAVSTNSAGAAAGLQPDKVPIWKLARAVIVLLLAGAAVFVVVQRRIWSNTMSSVPPIQSIAVLPLVNLSGDASQEYFADGMTDELITDMGQIGLPRVISRTSVMQYKGVKRPLPQIGRELHVDAVVEGTVERVGDRVRIRAKLIHAPTDRNIWSRSYERPMEDVLAMQDEVAEEIAAEIKTNVTAHQESASTSPRQVDPEAYELYLKGRFFWNKRTVEDFRKGLQYFEQAVAKDPHDGRGQAGIADSYLMLAEYGALPSRDAIPKAKAAALRAVELNDRLAEAHASLGALKEDYDWDWSGAEKEFKRALELNPSGAASHQWYAEFLAEMGRSDEAIKEITQASELDPLSLIVNSVVGEILYESHQAERAVPQLQKTLELDGNFAEAHRLLAESYLQLSRKDEAITELQKAVALSGGSVQNQAFLGHAYGFSGHMKEARAILEGLRKRSMKEYVSPTDLSLVYVGLGDKDRAIALLQEACDRRLPAMVNLKVDPTLDSLRSDARFQALLHRVGFPQ